MGKKSFQNLQYLENFSTCKINIPCSARLILLYKRQWKTSSFQMKLKQNWWKWANWKTLLSSLKIMGKCSRLYMSIVRVRRDHVLRDRDETETRFDWNFRDRDETETSTKWFSETKRRPRQEIWTKKYERSRPRRESRLTLCRSLKKLKVWKRRRRRGRRSCLWPSGGRQKFKAR